MFDIHAAALQTLHEQCATDARCSSSITIKYHIFGSWFFVLGARLLVPGPWNPGPYFRARKAFSMTQRSPYPRMVIALLALLGLLDASYLSLERLTGGDLICPTSGGCAIVQTSAYATLFGIPVAYLGVLGYLVLLGLALLSLEAEQVGELPVPALVLAVATIGATFSLYLVYLQIGVIGAICFWCMASALIEISIFIAALLNWRDYKGKRTVPPASKAQPVVRS